MACILVFNLSDLSGRILATYLQWPGRSSRGQWTFFAIVLLRLSLIPICMLCNAAPTARKLPGLNTNSTPFLFSILLHKWGCQQRIQLPWPGPGPSDKCIIGFSHCFACTYSLTKKSFHETEAPLRYKRTILSPVRTHLEWDILWIKYPNTTPAWDSDHTFPALSHLWLWHRLHRPHCPAGI